MDLDDLAQFRSLDPQDMIGQIYTLPEQLAEAWDIGMYLPLPNMDGLKNVVISGMGGSAIGADLLAAYAAPLCSVPIVVYRDYGLPAWVRGPENLVIVSSHSGNTEETLGVFEQARSKGCRVLVITTGGKLAELAQAGEVPLWRFSHTG